MTTLPSPASDPCRQFRAIYLNDHLAGAAGGVALARRVAKNHRGTPMSGELDQIASKIAAGRDTLRELMGTLGVVETRYKSLAALVGERLSRLKMNGRMRRSPLSTLLELEMLRLGVEGKAAGWRTLRELAEDDSNLDPVQIDRLIARATEQAGTLEQLRVTAAKEILIQN